MLELLSHFSSPLNPGIALGKLAHGIARARCAGKMNRHQMKGEQTKKKKTGCPRCPRLAVRLASVFLPRERRSVWRRKRLPCSLSLYQSNPVSNRSRQPTDLTHPTQATAFSGLGLGARHNKHHRPEVILCSFRLFGARFPQSRANLGRKFEGKKLRGNSCSSSADCRLGAASKCETRFTTTTMTG